jgi:hypothetical protein
LIGDPRQALLDQAAAFAAAGEIGLQLSERSHWLCSKGPSVLELVETAASMISTRAGTFIRGRFGARPSWG